MWQSLGDWMGLSFVVDRFRLAGRLCEQEQEQAGEEKHPRNSRKEGVLTRRMSASYLCSRTPLPPSPRFGAGVPKPLGVVKIVVAGDCNRGRICTPWRNATSKPTENLRVAGMLLAFPSAEKSQGTNWRAEIALLDASAAAAAATAPATGPVEPANQFVGQVSLEPFCCTRYFPLARLS
jgi:hypothetical protein